MIEISNIKNLIHVAATMVYQFGASFPNKRYSPEMIMDEMPSLFSDKITLSAMKAVFDSEWLRKSISSMCTGVDFRMIGFGGKREWRVQLMSFPNNELSIDIAIHELKMSLAKSLWHEMGFDNHTLL